MMSPHSTSRSTENVMSGKAFLTSVHHSSSEPRTSVPTASGFTRAVTWLKKSSDQKSKTASLSPANMALLYSASAARFSERSLSVTTVGAVVVIRPIMPQFGPASGWSPIGCLVHAPWGPLHCGPDPGGKRAGTRVGKAGQDMDRRARSRRRNLVGLLLAVGLTVGLLPAGTAG